MRARPLLLAVAAGLVLADASVVTLALPELLEALDTTVEGLAAVLGVYTAVLAAVLLALERAAAALGVRAVGAAGFALFAVACLACSQASDLTGLLIARGVQALGGAAGLVAVFALLAGAEGRGRRLWVGAAVFATALGPALGGALTSAFDWRAIFVMQVPVALAAAAACLSCPAVEPAPAERHRFAVRPSLALALVSAALTAVLFLLVLLLVAGWGLGPLRAAVTVTVLPLAALAGARMGGEPRARAAGGAALVGGGVLALALLPDAGSWWTVPPQAVAGVGMGLALTALGGQLLPERTAHDAARLLTLRHAGITAILVLLAPVAAAQLDDATARAKERGVAVLLDAELSIAAKLQTAPALLRGVERDRPRAGLRDAAAAERAALDGSERAAFDRVAQRADDVLVAAVADAFRTPFLLTGAAALLAALLVAPWPPGRVVAASAAVALATVAGYAVLRSAVAPEPVAIRDPCDDRPSVAGGGLQGFLQDRVYDLLDMAACRDGASREELVLALVDDDSARRYEAEHGRDPRSLLGLIGLR
jgi:MFS family permease